MENSKMVNTEKNNRMKMITLGNNLIYNHIIPNLDQKHASQYESMVAIYLDQHKNIESYICQKTFNDMASTVMASTVMASSGHA